MDVAQQIWVQWGALGLLLCGGGLIIWKLDARLQESLKKREEMAEKRAELAEKIIVLATAQQQSDRETREALSAMNQTIIQLGRK